MSIYGINPYEGYQSPYRIDGINSTDLQKVQNTEVTVNASENSAALPQIEEKPDTRSRFTDPNTISIGINKNDDFSYLGRDKDIQLLDMRKAISDMQKDSILQDYQYFVGSARNFRSEDGVVLQK